jgi:AcrR family transcriptional regulator
MSVAAAPAAVTPTPAAATSGVEARAVQALLVCVARFGLAKTTLDDVAREARCSRATLYRYFDNKPELVRRTVAAEHARITGLVVDAGRTGADFPAAVVAVTTTAARELVAHDALQFLLAHEPEAILGHLAFGAGDRVLVAVGDAIAPAFDPWLAPADAARVGDWLVRVLRSYVLMPRPPIDFTDPVTARPFLEQLVIPGFLPGPQGSR